MKTQDQIGISPFHTVGKSLTDKGLIVIPLREGQKAPAISNWTKLTLEQSKEHLENKGNFNAGLLLGKPSNIIALDFDSNVEGLHKKILKICGQSAVVKKGQKGGTIFFRYNGDKSKKWKKNGEMVLELLSDGTQTVIPPSVHPGTKLPYIYTKGKSLLDIELHELPYLPKDFIDRVDTLFDGNEDLTLGSDLDIAREALYFIQPDDYDTWLKCGMGLKNDFADEGFEVWEKWSLAHPKCKPEELFPKWESFKGDGITTASIFQLAIKNGYTPPRNASSFYNVNNAKLEMERWRLKGRPTGLATGIPQMDKLLHIRKKELTVVTGNPNSGKSEFLDHMIYKLVENHNQKVMFCSFENEPVEQLESFVHRFSGKDLHSRTNEEENDALSKVATNLFFYNGMYESRQLESVLEQAKQLHKTKKLDILVIDPYNVLTLASNPNEFVKAKETCNLLLRFAKKHDIHIFLVAHPRTQSGKDKASPTLADIAGGMAFWSMCDNGIVVSRGEEDTTISIQKVRRQLIDSCGDFNLVYNKSRRTFETYKGDF